MATMWFGPPGWLSSPKLQTFFPSTGADPSIFNTNVPGGTPAAPPTSQEVQVVLSLPLPGGTRVRRLTFSYRVSDPPIPNRPPTDFTRISGVELVEHVPGVAPVSRYLDPSLLLGATKKVYNKPVGPFVTKGALVLDVRLIFTDTLDLVELYEVGLECILPCTCPEKPLTRVMKSARKPAAKRKK